MKLPIDVERITTFTEAKNAIEKLLQAYSLLQKENGKLREEIARLKGQPKKPLFVDSLKRSKQQKSYAVTSLLREKQSWHKRSKGKIPVDHEENLPEVEECECGSQEFRSLRTYTRVTQGMVIKRNNVAYKARVKQCTRCGRKYKSPLPCTLKGASFDNNLQSLISFLKFACRMTQPLIYQMLIGFGIQISRGEINKILLQNGQRLDFAYHFLKTDGFKKSSHLQSDSTGAKRKEKTGTIRNQHMQLICNKLLSVFSITKRYNTNTLNRLLGKKGREKPFVSDDGSPNGDGLKIKHKQLCFVHEIRHYKKLFPFFNSHQQLQKQTLEQWRKFYHLAKHYGESPPEARKKKKEQIQNLFDHITSQVTGYDLLDKQLQLTKKKKDRLLLFLNYPFLPIHNNQCEQDLREFVIQRKISRETKAVEGDKSIARHLSIIQTAQKQGLDVFQTLHGLLTNQLSPAILTANIS